MAKHMVKCSFTLLEPELFLEVEKASFQFGSIGLGHRETG